jgi:hypothetical protein
VSRNPFSHLGAFGRPADIGGFFAKYSWILIKNLVGWVFIICAVPVAGLFPGPLGLPMFLIGFALVTLPGKRRLTSRVLRGIPININSSTVRTWRTVAAILLPPFFPLILAWVESHRPEVLAYVEHFGATGMAAAYLVCVTVTWIGSYWFLRAVNVAMRFIPGVRRRIRPWMRRRGINLLPPRHNNLGKRSYDGNEESL